MGRRFVLGVTGAVGAGKSTVCQLLAARGFAVLDVDDVAAEAVSEALPAIAQRLPGARTATGSVNKGAIFAAMLSDAGFRQDLEQQLRPLIIQRIRRWSESLTGPGALEAALLFESGLDALCDATLGVRCDLAERQRRVEQRSTASARHFAAVDAAQWPQEAKLARAGAVVSTQGDREQLAAHLAAALQQLGAHEVQKP